MGVNKLQSFPFMCNVRRPIFIMGSTPYRYNDHGMYLQARNLCDVKIDCIIVNVTVKRVVEVPMRGCWNWGWK